MALRVTAVSNSKYITTYNTFQGKCKEKYFSNVVTDLYSAKNRGSFRYHQKTLNFRKKEGFSSFIFSLLFLFPTTTKFLLEEDFSHRYFVRKKNFLPLQRYTQTGPIKVLCQFHLVQIVVMVSRRKTIASQPSSHHDDGIIF